MCAFISTCKGLERKRRPSLGLYMTFLALHHHWARPLPALRLGDAVIAKLDHEKQGPWWSAARAPPQDSSSSGQIRKQSCDGTAATSNRGQWTSPSRQHPVKAQRQTLTVPMPPRWTPFLLVRVWGHPIPFHPARPWPDLGKHPSLSTNLSCRWVWFMWPLVGNIYTHKDTLKGDVMDN